MEVILGCCGLVLAFICIFLGMAEVGLWVACYFECPDGQLIEFNYFAAVWTGVLAFTVGFMIIVLFCVKFKSLGTFIVVLTFLLVPCEIICVCIYGYRAYLSRPIGDAVTGNVGVDYFSVFLFSAMAVCGVFLFLVTITWNCYYCCIATPVEDFEEEVKEDLEEENERQGDLQTTQDNVFVNNPVLDDESRPNQTRPALNFAQQPRGNQQPSNGRFPHSVQNGYPQAMPRQNGNTRQYGSNLDSRRDNRGSRYPQQQPIRNDYPYPAAFSREPVYEERDRRNRQQSMMPRPQLGPNHQSYMRNEGGRGQVNRGYEPDQFGQPIDRSYNLRSYIYDGMQGESYGQPIYSPGQENPQREQSRRQPNHYDANPNASADYLRAKSRRHVNRPPNYQPPGYDREPGTSTQPKMEDRSYIYRPRPENFRGKPPKPEYMQGQQQQPQSTAQNSNYVQASVQNSRESGPGARGSGGPVDSYF